MKIDGYYYKGYVLTKVTNGTDKFGNTYKNFTVEIYDTKITAKAFCRFNGELCYGDLRVVTETNAENVETHIRHLKYATELIDKYAKDNLFHQKWQ